MKTIGLIAGMSWESSAEYYRIINEAVRHRLGGLHSAECIMYSVDFARMERLQAAGEWDQVGAELAQVAKGLERAGAEILVLATNTMHKVADVIEAAVTIPLLHIADATAERVKAQGVERVGLLGTRFTMEEDFYAGHLAARRGLRVMTPGPEARQIVNDIIFRELCRGIVRESSRMALRGIMAGLAASGAQGIVLGCTELSMLVGAADAPVPVFDTTRIHAEAAVDWALGGEF
ncbi:MAG: aspartate/glutamate racemase family protein [Firmicutes bacterium]|jgi:aspartate racemase|nr:aspartate/glutamate racemase family protein [Bacillota bacterium]